MKARNRRNRRKGCGVMGWGRGGLTQGTQSCLAVVKEVGS